LVGELGRGVAETVVQTLDELIGGDRDLLRAQVLAEVEADDVAVLVVERPAGTRGGGPRGLGRLGGLGGCGLGGGSRSGGGFGRGSRLRIRRARRARDRHEQQQGGESRQFLHRFLQKN